MVNKNGPIKPYDSDLVLSCLKYKLAISEGRKVGIQVSGLHDLLNNNAPQYDKLIRKVDSLAANIKNAFELIVKRRSPYSVVGKRPEECFEILPEKVEDLPELIKDLPEQIKNNFIKSYLNGLLPRSVKDLSEGAVANLFFWLYLIKYRGYDKLEAKSLVECFYS